MLTIKFYLLLSYFNNKCILYANIKNYNKNIKT